MVFHGRKWGWKGLAARTLLAPVLAAGLAAPAHAQTAPAAAKAADPAALLRQGREALKAGRFDQAQDLANQADRANAGGRWGLWGDTPDGLAREVRAARGKADKARGEQLCKDAKAAFAKSAQMKNPADRLAALDQAYALCDQAVALCGPADMIDDLFGGDRPDKLKKEIDTARLQLRRTAPAADLAKAGVQSAQATAKPGAGSGLVQAKAQLPAPTLPAPSLPTGPIIPAAPVLPAVADVGGSKAQAGRLVADGRALLKANKLADAKAKVGEAQKLGGSYGPGDDTPDALLRDVLADGKKQMDELTAASKAAAERKDFVRAELSAGLSKSLAVELGFPTAAADEQIAAVAVAKSGKPAPMAVPPVAVAVAPVVPAVVAPAMPDLPAAPTLPGVPAIAPVMPAPAVAAAPMTPAGEGGLPLALPVPSAAPAPAGQLLLAEAQAELRRNELEAARRLAVKAHDEPGSKDEAQKLLKLIDAETAVRRQKDADAGMQAAADAIGDKQYAQAAGILRVVDADRLPPDQQKRHNELMAQALGGADRQALPPPTGAPAAPAPATLADQQKAMGEVEFGKLRSEALDVQSRAGEAWKKGETDLAVGLLADFVAKVKAGGLSPSRQMALTSGAQSRLDNYRSMKHQTDFVLRESRDKKDVRERVAGKQLAEQGKQEEIAKKSREVNDLAKAHKFRDAEALALQLKNLDPDNPSLTALYDVTKMKRRQDDATALKKNKEELVLNGLNSAEQPGPIVDTLNPVAPNVERQLNALRRGTGNDNYLKSRTAAERDIERKLDALVSVDLKGVPLREAVGRLGGQVPGGLNVSFDDAALAEKGLAQAVDGVVVNESLKDISLRNVLDIVLKKGKLKFVVENDVLQVTTEERAKGRLVTKVFSVMDLITPIPDYALYDHQDLNKQLAKVGAMNNMTPWERLGGGGSGYTPPNGLGGGSTLTAQPGGGAGGASPFLNGPNTITSEAAGGASALSTQGGMPTTKQANLQKLQNMVKAMVRPYTWQDTGGPGSLSYYDLSGALVVNQTADIIREVEDLLESLRRLQETSISVEIRVISLSEAFFERVGVDFSMNVVTKGSGREQFDRSISTGTFRPEPFTNSINNSGNGAVIGYNPANGGFTPDLNVPIRSTSYPFSVPPFGGYQGSLNPNLNGGLSVGLAFLNDIQVFMFMEAAQGDRRVNIMQAPKLTLFNGQTANVFVSDVSFFTLGVTAINVGGQFVYVPQNVPLPVGNAPPPPGSQAGATQPGVSVAVQGIVSADRRFVRLNLTPQLTALTSATVPLFPVTAFVTPVFEGGSQGVPIPFTQFFQQPSVTEIQVQTTVACPDGGTVVLGGLKTMSEGRNEFGPPVLSNIPYLNRLFRNTGVGRETRHIMIMVTPRIIIQSEEELNQTGASGLNQLPPPTAGQ